MFVESTTKNRAVKKAVSARQIKKHIPLAKDIRKKSGKQYYTRQSDNLPNHIEQTETYSKHITMIGLRNQSESIKESVPHSISFSFYPY